MKRYIVLVLFTLLMIFAQVSEATFITIETKTVVDIEGDTAKVLIEVTNKGDEPAYNIRISSDIEGNIQTGKLKDKLSVNNSYSEEFTSTVKFEKPGRYPVIVMVEYTDANQYPFTAISAANLNYKEGVVGRVIGEISPITITDSGTLKVSVKNLEETDKVIDLRIVLPKDISSPTVKKELSLKGSSREVVDFKLKNLAALPGSNYRIYAILEYEDDKYHYANTIGANIKVEEDKGILATYKLPLIAILIILAVVVVYFNLRRNKG